MSNSRIFMNCPYCNNKNVMIIKERCSEINQKIYKLYHCKNCDIQFFTPLEFENIYESNIYEDIHLNKYPIQPCNKAVLKYVKKNNLTLNNKTIFEIGAGSGNNFTLLQKEFLINPENYFVNEVDTIACKVLEKKGLPKIFKGYFGKDLVKTINRKFDIVIATEVLEHQIDPKGFLDCAFEITNDDGIILLTTPNRDRNTFLMNLINSGNDGDEPPHHFLKINCNFYKKNYEKNLINYDYFAFPFKNHISSYKKASMRLCRLVNIPEKLFFIFIPFIPFLSLLYSVIFSYDNKAEILVALKKNILNDIKKDKEI